MVSEVRKVDPWEAVMKRKEQRKCGTYTPWNTMQPKKKDEFMSFAGTWMKLETIILSKLTQEQKTRHCMFSLISGS